MTSSGSVLGSQLEPQTAFTTSEQFGGFFWFWFECSPSVPAGVGILSLLDCVVVHVADTPWILEHHCTKILCFPRLVAEILVKLVRQTMVSARPWSIDSSGLSSSDCELWKSWRSLIITAQKKLDLQQARFRMHKQWTSCDLWKHHCTWRTEIPEIQAQMHVMANFHLSVVLGTLFRTSNSGLQRPYRARTNSHACLPKLLWYRKACRAEFLRVM